MYKYDKIRHTLVFMLTILSSILSALTLSFDSLPDLLRDSLPESIKIILVFIIMLSSVVGVLIHALSPSNNGGNSSSTQHPNN